MGLQCQILLPPKEEVYRGGDFVEGTLKYSLDEPMLFNSIFLFLSGRGECYWTESDDDNSSKSYRGTEEYVSEKMTIQALKGTVEPSVYEYQFKFQLPKVLPTSFHDTICTISYKVVAEFHIPGIFKSKVFDTEIPVYGPLKRVHPQPLIFGLTKTPFSLTSKGPVDLKVEIDKTYLTPGEKITLKCTTTNNSGVPVTGIITRLVNKTTYISDFGHKRIRTDNVDGSVWEWVGTDKNSVNTVICDVPTQPNLFTIQHTKVMTRDYLVTVTVKLPFPHVNASVELPVVIGEISPDSGLDMAMEEKEKDELV
ncbi:arrestin domain-containing protein 2-like [Anticarsia gemmatalis]|uniref:arrestin domain-containing protein 2-like n=1 Tax=Anticarsia gemmatalis TaxID=129554 RepID=UPI003F76BFD9